MNPPFPQRQRPSLLARINALLAILLAVTWSISFFYFVKIHSLDVTVTGNAVPGNLEPNHFNHANNHHQHGQQQQGGDPSSSIPSSSSSESKDVHIVFSTDCSGYQHWQSIASYYSLRRAGHLGPITRIASGCNPSQEKNIREEFHKIQRNSNNNGNGNGNNQLRIHFTPSFALKSSHYKYSNKPSGLYHWMNHTTIKEPVVALVDPDMLALRPIVPTLGEGMTAAPVTSDGYRDLIEYREDDEHRKVLLLRQKRLPSLPSRVTEGVAAGQHFGLGGMWASAGTKRAGKDFKEFNLTMVCGANSPCLNNVPPEGSDASSSNSNSALLLYTSREFADANYAVGPVYIASTTDWKSLLPRWHAFTPRVHAQYPKLLAEMFAFTMSAADMQLKFALSSSYMVSDPNTMSTTEGWLWIDEYANANKNKMNPVLSIGEHDDDGNRQQSTTGDYTSLRTVCEGATSNSLPTETLRRLENYGYGNYHHRSNSNVSPSTYNDNGISSGPLPTFLHFCQNYKLADHTFAKRKMPHDFFRCNGSPLDFDVEAIMKELESMENGDDRASLSENQKKKQMRTGFMLCHLIPLMNMALDEYKLDVC